jgi:peptide/nickel transport system permease protein
MVTALANIGITVPIFWLGILLIYLFALKLGLLPVFGYTSPFVDFWQSTKQLILPVFCLAIYPIAANSRITRNSMLEVLRQDYIRTAWAKGLEERIIIRHGMKMDLSQLLPFGMTISHIFGVRCH